jgi:F-type H+-transporting ATPase subunit gamma
MKMVAASKLRRAQERIIATRPYAAEARRVLESIASRVDQTKHPLLQQRPGARDGATMLLVVTSDRGLCGSFNTNIVKAVSQFIVDNPGRPVSVGLIGRKGRDVLRRRGLSVRFEHVNLPKVIHFAEAETIAQPAVSDFIEGRVDSVYVIYNEFKSVIAQQVVVEQVLPLAPIVATPRADDVASEYIYEPSPQQIFDQLLGRLVEAQLLRSLLESSAAEHAARMTAMDAATRNSADMIEDLTLTMNKVRQAAITREIIEVVSGAQAL